MIHPDSPTLDKDIRYVLANLGITQTSIAKSVNVSPLTLRAMLKRHSHDLNLKYRIAEYLNTLLETKQNNAC
jgi:DNA-binding XRE family transcriptional regulator